MCSLGSGSVLAFGDYDVLSSRPTDSTGTIIFRCGNRDKDIRISLDRGNGSSYTTRRLTKGNEQLFYNIYLDAARTVIWGDGTNGSGVYFNHNPQPNNEDILLPVYGRIFPGQSASSGTYTDSITITLNY